MVQPSSASACSTSFPRPSVEPDLGGQPAARPDPVDVQRSPKPRRRDDFTPPVHAVRRSPRPRCTARRVGHPLGTRPELSARRAREPRRLKRDRDRRAEISSAAVSREAWSASCRPLGASRVHQSPSRPFDVRARKGLRYQRGRSHDRHDCARRLARHGECTDQGRGGPRACRRCGRDAGAQPRPAAAGAGAAARREVIAGRGPEHRAVHGACGRGGGRARLRTSALRRRPGRRLAVARVLDRPTAALGQPVRGVDGHGAASRAR
jgi:hypothetical protein